MPGVEPSSVTEVRAMEVRVNGVTVELEKGESLLQAAERAGFKVPTLCHHPAVPAQGSCRVCMVEEEGSGRLLTACDTPAREGMSILLDTERVLEARRYALRLIFSGHPVHCEVCEAANDCRLRELAAEMGLSGRELPLSQDFRPVMDANPFYHRDLSKCISCGLCVRACQEVQGVGNYEMLGRGPHARPGTVLDTHLEASVCEFCGLCASLCPVGALFQRPYLHRGAEERRVITICPYCGVGCSLVLKVRGNRIVGVEAGVEGSVNGWSLCVKGRYGLDFVDHPDRLRKPLLRKDGELVEAEWEEALGYVASRLAEIRERHGPDSIAFLASAKATNEENYLLQKFARAVVGTNNVDHCARL